ncbi:hypothetical protein JNB11_05385 [Kocuria palustris]|nr:hypothetical protein [Kocuria palustris]
MRSFHLLWKLWLSPEEYNRRWEKEKIRRQKYRRLRPKGSGFGIEGYGGISMASCG